MEVTSILLPIIISSIVTFITTKWIIISAKSRGFVGKDINKKNKPEIPSLGGIGIVAGFVAGCLTLLGIFKDQRIIAPILLTSLIIGFLGLLDDIFNIRQSIRAILPVFASVPLSIYSLGHSTINIPFIGVIDFSIWYYIILVPASVTIASNAFNMLEGLNGLGAGLGVIMALAFAIIGLNSKGATYLAGIISLILISTLITFLYFNFYPAKIFPGNIGTYFIGAVIGAIGIAGFMLTALAILYIPYVIEFVLKARTRFKGISFGDPDENGILHWNSFPNSLTHVIMKLGKFKEYEIVIILWLIESAFAVLAIFLQRVT
ncbi:MAG: UDP-N-acetylglucosamine--dolichyl-phosphate N-acetylglucosaminephosphotransferase [Sulfolobaceae archaeon]